MDPLLITVAFILGFLVKQVGLPPLVGFLAAGFVLNGLGFEGGETLQTIADLGVTLLLFSIGLKLNLRNLAKPEVWAGSSLHMLLTVAIFSAGLFGLSMAGLPLFSDLTFPLAVLIAFALSFSSTVFAVKILEDKGEIGALHGRVSIGILIMQDIFAVLFLTISLGKLPSAWALLIPLALWGLRPLLFYMMTRSGHGELLLLFGLFAALVTGAGSFELVGLKADLGALILGILLASHPKSSELAKTLMGFKELLLVGFFLTIGLAGTPNLVDIGIAALLVVAAPLKVALFYLLMTRFKLRARAALLGSLSLANYSEFGLIVAAVGSSQGWIDSEWLLIIALALSATFVIASPLNTMADALYKKYREQLCKFEVEARHAEEQPVDLGETAIGIFGMGRIGTTVYDFMCEKYGENVIGFDFNAAKVKQHCDAGRRVVLADPTDPDFWPRINRQKGKTEMAVLAMPKHQANLAAAKHLVSREFNGIIVATAHFDDQIRELENVGVTAAFNFYNEAGLGFAKHASSLFELNPSPATGES